MQHTLRWKRLLMLCLALVMAGAALMAVSAARAEELSLTVSSGGEYPWTYDAETGEFFSYQESSEKNVSTLTVRVGQSGTLEFSYLLDTIMDDTRISEKLTVTRIAEDGGNTTYTYQLLTETTTKIYDEFQSVQLEVAAGDVLEFTYDKTAKSFSTDGHAVVRFENAAVEAARAGQAGKGFAVSLLLG